MRLRARRHLQSGPAASLLGGAIVGLCATQALDWLSIYLYENEDLRTRIEEDHARNHMHAYEVAVDKLTRAVGVKLDRAEVGRWGWRLHKAFGLLGGVGYMALRRRFPKIGMGLGLAFGTAFFVGVDELLVPALGLTPGPAKFSWKVHARGAASHIAYGVVAETTARSLLALASEWETRVR